MGRFKNGILAAVILFLLARLSGGIDEVASTISSSCMIAYDDGGAPAVLQSSGCAVQWRFLVESLKNSSKNCEFASLQGHRKYQEDRVACNLDIRIPLIGKDATNEAKVDLLAIFDGHGGTEASETAKQHLLDYFLIHVIAGAYKKSSILYNNQGCSSHGFLLEIEDKSLHDVLKEALLDAIRDIDLKFSSEAIQKRYNAGSTASVVLLLNNEEFLIIEMMNGPALNSLVVGFVLDWGVPRVNGILAVSRAIGDVSLKRYGLIAKPETVGWRNVTDKDSYLVIASDGVFESLTPENVCQLIEDAKVQENGTTFDKFPFLPSPSLAYYVVKTALKRGSTDNLSAIVVPLAQAASAALVDKDEL
ncbi:hypothetical protein LXL04_001016 [Taraxacum kok-saghyz]